MEVSTSAPSAQGAQGTHARLDEPSAGPRELPAPAANNLAAQALAQGSTTVPPGEATNLFSLPGANGSSLPYSCGEAMRVLNGEDGKCCNARFSLAQKEFVLHAVFDGHSGGQASQFCAAHMVDYVAEAALRAHTAAGTSAEPTIAGVVEACKVRVDYARTRTHHPSLSLPARAHLRRRRA